MRRIWILILRCNLSGQALHYRLCKCSAGRKKAYNRVGGLTNSGAPLHRLHFVILAIQNLWPTTCVLPLRVSRILARLPFPVIRSSSHSRYLGLVCLFLDNHPSEVWIVLSFCGGSWLLSSLSWLVSDAGKIPVASPLGLATKEKQFYRLTSINDQVSLEERGFAFSGTNSRWVLYFIHFFQHAMFICFLVLYSVPFFSKHLNFTIKCALWTGDVYNCFLQTYWPLSQVRNSSTLKLSFWI